MNEIREVHVCVFYKFRRDSNTLNDEIREVKFCARIKGCFVTTPKIVAYARYFGNLEFLLRGKFTRKIILQRGS